MAVVATAGHVDHGKSTLVLALTGMDPDRWAEEKERGLTIDLGFAWTTLPGAGEVAFVDVPGHVRFIKNMLAGVGAVDACLFVVDATEGWKPQSEEHLRILQLLGIDRGLVALTKVALVDDDTAELARMDVEEHVAGTFLDGAAVVAVDAPAGHGMAELRTELDQLLATLPAPADQRRPRLWVDRAFAAKGAGTVVTGTLTGGSLAADDALVLVPQRRRVRVRGLQSHKAGLDVAPPGRRLAVNLAGIEHHAVARGDALVAPDQWEPTRMFDARLRVLPGLDHDVGRRGAFHLYVGAADHSCQLRLLAGESRIPPGAAGLVRIHVDRPVALVPGDRFVLREAGRDETVGGGEVLDVAPVLPARRARPDRSVDRVIAERGWVEAGLLERLTGQRRSPTVGRWVVDPTVLAAAAADLRARVEAAGSLGLDVAALDERARAVAEASPQLGVAGGWVRLAPPQEPAGDGEGGGTGDGVEPSAATHPYLATLEANLFAPPTPEEAGADRAEVRDLVRRGLVVERDGMHFAPTAVDRAAAAIAGLLATNPEGVTVSAIREALGTSRKYLLPLLAHLDASGITRRRGDVRVGGPRLPQP